MVFFLLLKHCIELFENYEERNLAYFTLSSFTIFTYWHFFLPGKHLEQTLRGVTFLEEIKVSLKFEKMLQVGTLTKKKTDPYHSGLYCDRLVSILLGW